MSANGTKQGSLTHEYLREVLSYDPNTGVFVWKKRISIRITVGKVAGIVMKIGYLSIRVNGVICYAHRLAWFYHFGTWPKKHIDHINGNKLDNRIANLRDVTHKQNHQNTKRTHNAKGYTRHGNKWVAQIKQRDGSHYLGTFDTKEEAAEAYRLAKEEHHDKIVHIPPII